MTTMAALLCVTLPAPAQAQSAPVASLDRQQIRLGETVTLQVVGEGQNLSSPDFGPLAVDFDLLGSSTSSHFSIIGGQTVARTTWTVELEPRRAGILRIPPIPVGVHATTPLTLTVTAATDVAAGNGEDVFLELDIEPRDPYVQQPVQMVVRLYYAVGLTEGNLREPEVEDAAMTRLGQDRNYAAERHGRRYQVVERVFSLRPERSGEVRIGPAQFHGRALRQGTRRSLMDPGVRVSARTPPQSLNVRPRPAAARGDWLPARSVHIEDELGPDPSSARVGEPLTRSVRLLVEGLSLDQLPELVHPELAGAQIYADRPVGHGRESGGWPSAEREYRFAIVPGEPGELVLPEMRISWWDVQTDQAREAVLPMRTVTVGAATAGTAAIPAQDIPVGIAVDDSGAPSVPTPGLWPWISLGLGGLWLATMGGWWWTARASRTGAEPAMPGAGADPGPSREAFRRAVHRADAGGALSALLAWSRAEDPAVRHLGELRLRLADDAQRSALAALEQGRYGPGGELSESNWRELANAFADGPTLDAEAVSARRTESVLPPLWPQRD
ncbi:MAG TPA: BatD family protein [Xanthomonadaceae bacterium]|nr:BatD family protein [Xanthomonadaceae bacterium]